MQQVGTIYTVIRARQELNRYKDRYTILKGGNSTAYSYCRSEVEDEQHLYNDCRIVDELVLVKFQGGADSGPERFTPLWNGEGTP